MSTRPRSQDITRVTLAVLFIGVLIGAVFLVLQPLLPPLLWAMIIVVATWPVLLRVQQLLGGRRRLAAAFMTLLLVLIVVVPLAAAIWTIISYSDVILEWTARFGSGSLPPPPSWVGDLPIAGPKLAGEWQRLAAEGPEALAPYLGGLAAWFVAEVGSFGLLLVHLLLTAVLAAVLYSRGDAIGAYVIRFGGRLAGERGEKAALMAAQSIRAVALGVVITAVVQTAIGGVGLFAAGVPFAPLFTALILILALVQIGPAPLLVPIVVWLYWSGQTFAGTVMVVFSALAMTIDNVLRPIVIRWGGADLPLPLIFAGVIGGLVGFGIIGLFVGPAVLAVSYTLLLAWIDDDALAAPDAAQPSAAAAPIR